MSLLNIALAICLDKSMHAAWPSELNVYFQAHVLGSNLDLHRPQQHICVTADFEDSL